MKKQIICLSITLVLPIVVFSQDDSLKIEKNKDSIHYQKGWYIAGAIDYGRFMAIDAPSYSDDKGNGLHITLGSQLSQNMEAYIAGEYAHIESVHWDPNANPAGNVHQKANIGSLSLGMSIIVLKCERFSPKIMCEFGPMMYKVNNTITTSLEGKTLFDYQMGFGMGFDYKVSRNVTLFTESRYQLTGTSRLDGHNDNISYVNKGFLGGNGDSRVSMGFGIKLKFGQKGASACNLTQATSPLVQKQPSTKIIVIDASSNDHSSTNNYYGYAEGSVVPRSKLSGTEAISRELEYILPIIHFEFDKDNLRPGETSLLDRLVKLLLIYDDVDLLMSGHADSFGSNEYNMALSRRRVESVQKYLISKGINKKRLEISYLGELDPVRSNTNTWNRALNRRVEIRVK